MPRIRTIKPQHVSDKELSKISLPAHLFWVLSWCFSDDEGVMENDPLLLKSQLFPRRTDIRIEQVQQWIDQLIKARFIIPFTHDGEGYLLHRTFRTHQKIDKPQPSKIPTNVIRRVIDEHSTIIQPCIVEDSKSKGREDSFVPNGPDIAQEYKELEKTKKSVVEFIKNKSPDFIEPFFDLWNLFAQEKGMPVAKTLNDNRRKKFKVRIKEPPFNMIEILRKAGQSDFLLTGGKWFGFDWIIDNSSNYLKVLEGNYDNGKALTQKEKDGLSEVEKHKSEAEKAIEKQRAILASD